MNNNLIYRAAILAEPDAAAERLAKALDVECGPHLADRRSWIHAGHAARCLMIAEWLRNVCYEAGAQGERLAPWTPIGGEKYSRQND